MPAEAENSTVHRFPTKRKAAYPNRRIDWRTEGAPEGVAVLKPKGAPRWMPERSSIALVLAGVLKVMTPEQHLRMREYLFPCYAAEEPEIQAAWNFAVAVMNRGDF